MILTGHIFKRLLSVSVLLVLFAIGETNSQGRQEQLRQQIEQLKARIAEQTQEEVVTVGLLDDIEHEIVLTQELLKQQQQEEKNRRVEFKKTQKALEQTEKEVARLRRLYAQRLVYIYKHGFHRDLEIFLTANSFNRIYSWLKYQKLLAENDRRNIRNIQRKQSEISQQQTKLKQIWAETQKLIEVQHKKNQELQTRQAQRKQFLTKIRNNIKTYQQEINHSLAQIQDLIATEESQRQQSPSLQKLPVVSHFPELKGKMIWPVNGRVIKNFGHYQHPKLKTITQNLGIDIKAGNGTPVKAVADGMVARIQWMRGIGVLILLNHAAGYYTVYANLGEVLVKNNQLVEMGQMIGYVGEIGLEEQSKLHFQIWEKNNPINPLIWLRKNGI